MNEERNRVWEILQREEASAREAVAQERMGEFIITFGFGHHDERNGTLANCCTRVVAATENDARMAIAAIRGEKWCASYQKEDGEEIIKRYGVREIPFSEIGPQIGETL